MKSRLKPALRTPTTPSQFFPPSYFAAAAGVVYPLDSAPLPLRTPSTGPHDPLSSNASHLLAECLPSMSNNTNVPLGRARRRSQLGDLERIECQLLPTLSDTIERMTRPPSQMISMSPLRPQGPAPPDNVTRTPSTSSTPYPAASELHSASVAMAQTPTIHSMPAKQPPLPSILRSPSNGYPEQLLPPLPTTRSSSSRPNPKSILKSHTLSEQVRQPHLDAQCDPARKAGPTSIPHSTPIPIPIPPEPARSEGKREHARPMLTSPRPKIDVPARSGRARSRTDPGALPKGSPSTRGNAAPPNPNLMHSGIPRRVGVPPSPAPSRTVAPTSHAGLEPAANVQATPREKRRLFVTNAEIPSSSSSESHVPFTRHVKLKTLQRTDTQSSVDSQLRQPRFGLGLGLSGINEPKHSIKSPGQRRTAKSPNDEPLARHSHKRHPCDETATPGRRDRPPSRNGHIESADAQRRRRELLSRVPADVYDSSGCDSQSEGYEDPCVVSDGSGNSLRSAFDDSGSEYSPVGDDDRDRPYSSTRWGTKPEQARSKARQSRNHFSRGDSELVDEQCTPRASSTPSFNRQSRSQIRGHPMVAAHNEESVETGSSTLASDGDACSIGETVPLAVPARYSSDLSRIMAVSSAAAARQREAFGISSSLDLEDYHQVDASTIPHADSEMSLVGDHIWQDECDEFATGSLLQRLDQQCNREYGNQRSSTGGHSLSSAPTQSSVSRESIYSTPNSPTRRSDRSIVVPESPPAVPTVREQEWQVLEMYILESYGEAEARRQRFVWEFTESEDDFVTRLQNMIQLFILPLRVRDTRTWVSGIPSDVMKLFDWLDDIVRVHAQLSSTLACQQILDHPRLQMISEVFRDFVPRLETHQPYLVKLEFTASVIDSLILERNDFGEFIKLQEASGQCQGWSLEKYLIEPVNRLAQYPDVFRKLLQLTPKCHPDYMSTFSLLHTAKLTIRVLSEVKDREDAYEFVKMACSGIKGIASVHLIHRDRRLLIRGSLTCVQVSNDEQASSLEPLPLTDSQTNSRPGRRAEKLAKAVNVWRGRSNSIKSTASTVLSFSTAPSSFDVHVGHPPALGTPVVRVESERIEVEVLVFSDIVLLASRLESSSNGGDGSGPEMCDLEPLEVIGLSRVVSVLDEIDGRARITLDVAPLTAHDLEEGLVQSTGSVVTISLSLPQRAPQGNGASGERLGSLHDWLEPLRRSCQYTLRASSSLSTTSALVHRARFPATGAKPVLSLLAAGLPLPKSPSMQIEETQRGVAGDSERQEREERGWWSKRFYEVFAELSEQDGRCALNWTWI